MLELRLGSASPPDAEGVGATRGVGRVLDVLTAGREDGISDCRGDKRDVGGHRIGNGARQACGPTHRDTIASEKRIAVDEKVAVGLVGVTAVLGQLAHACRVSRRSGQPAERDNSRPVRLHSAMPRSDHGAMIAQIRNRRFCHCLTLWWLTCCGMGGQVFWNSMPVRYNIRLNATLWRQQKLLRSGPAIPLAPERYFEWLSILSADAFSHSVMSMLVCAGYPLDSKADKWRKRCAVRAQSVTSDSRWTHESIWWSCPRTQTSDGRRTCLSSTLHSRTNLRWVWALSTSPFAENLLSVSNSM